MFYYSKNGVPVVVSLAIREPKEGGCLLCPGSYVFSPFIRVVKERGGEQDKDDFTKIITR